MIALQIQNIKQFMNRLLLSTAFDSFLLLEGAVTTYCTFSMNGKLHRDFFTEEELEEQNMKDQEYSRWHDVKPIFLDLIKGKKTPLGFKFIFRLSPENTAKLLASSGITSIRPENVSGLLLNVRYDGTGLSCVTATSLNFFTMDKSLERAWDEMLKRFLKQQEISFL